MGLSEAVRSAAVCLMLALATYLVFAAFAGCGTSFDRGLEQAHRVISTGGRATMAALVVECARRIEVCKQKNEATWAKCGPARECYRWVETIHKGLLRSEEGLELLQRIYKDLKDAGIKTSMSVWIAPEVSRWTR